MAILGIGGSNEYKSEAWFVCGKDLEKNELIVGQGHDSIYLESNWCTATDANWISYKPVEGKEYTANFRYRQKDIAVTIEQPIETQDDIDRMISVINSMYNAYLVAANLKLKD